MAAVAALGGFSGGPPQAAAMAPDPDPAHLIPARKGHILSASLPSTVFTEGQPVLLSVVYRNGSPEPVTIWSRGVWPNHSVNVSGDDGREPEMTDRGRRRRQAFAPDGGRDKNLPVPVQPGGVYRCASALDLTDLYRLRPGRYTVRVTYHESRGPTPLKLTSGPVGFEITSGKVVR